MSPLKSLLSEIFTNIKDVIISTFTSTPYYKTLKSTYYKKGLFSLLNVLAIHIYSRTTKYVQHNLYYIIGFQCICIHQALLGYNFWLIISLLHMIIHLPFFIISIAAYITIINRNFYKEHPLFFTLYGCACLLLLVVLILLLVILCGLILDLIDDYFLQTKSNGGGSTEVTNPGSEPSSGPGLGPSGGDSGPSDFYPIGSQEPNDEEQYNNNWAPLKEIVYTPVVDREGNPRLDDNGCPVYVDQYKKIYTRDTDGDFIRVNTDGGVTIFKNYGNIDPNNTRNLDPYQENRDAYNRERRESYKKAKNEPNYEEKRLEKNRKRREIFANNQNAPNYEEIRQKGKIKQREWYANKKNKPNYEEIRQENNRKQRERNANNKNAPNYEEMKQEENRKRRERNANKKNKD